MGIELETVKREGVDLVFAVDVSKSMLAEDIAPNRLEKAKRLVSETINKLSGDRVGNHCLCSKCCASTANHYRLRICQALFTSA